MRKGTRTWHVITAAFVAAVLFTAGDLHGDESVPVNPYQGMEQRQEVFEFAEKPAVKKEGDKYVITFASKGKCDATVAVLDKDDKIVRHLASGVLGKNAPWPFEQGTLAQRIEWDGKDDLGRPVPDGCRVKVSLGLKPAFGKALGWHPKVFVEPYGHVPVVGLAADKDGVYVANPSRVGQRVRMFDHPLDRPWRRDALRPRGQPGPVQRPRPG